MEWEMILLLILAGPFVIYWVAREGIMALRKKAGARAKE